MGYVPIVAPPSFVLLHIQIGLQFLFGSRIPELLRGAPHPHWVSSMHWALPFYFAAWGSWVTTKIWQQNLKLSPASAANTPAVAAALGDERARRNVIWACAREICQTTVATTALIAHRIVLDWTVQRITEDTSAMVL
jgi:hypothetical protein